MRKRRRGTSIKTGMLHGPLYRSKVKKIVDSVNEVAAIWTRAYNQGGNMDHILTRPVDGQVVKSFVSRPETPSKEEVAKSLGISRQWLDRWCGSTIDLPKLRQQAEVLRFMYYHGEGYPSIQPFVLSGELLNKRREEIGWSNFELATLLGITERQLINWKKQEAVGVRLERMVRVLTYIVLYEYERIKPVRRQVKESANGVSRETA